MIGGGVCGRCRSIFAGMKERKGTGGMTGTKLGGLIKRYVLLCVGLVIMSFGVAFSIKAGLGTSPISGLPYVTGQISGLSVGTTTIFLHVTLIVL